MRRPGDGIGAGAINEVTGVTMAADVINGVMAMTRSAAVPAMTGWWVVWVPTGCSGGAATTIFAT